MDNENNKYDDGTKIGSERYFNADDYENMGAVFVPSKILGDEWVWEKYNDGSGCLKSPDGKWYMSYDLSTNEYMPTEDSHWEFFPISYYYADGTDPNSFDCFEYMEKEMKKLILKQENDLSI